MELARVVPPRLARLLVCLVAADADWALDLASLVDNSRGHGAISGEPGAGMVRVEESCPNEDVGGQEGNRDDAWLLVCQAETDSHRCLRHIAHRPHPGTEPTEIRLPVVLAVHRPSTGRNVLPPLQVRW